MKNKVERFELRLTEQEKKVLARNAERNKMTISSYIRARCIYTLDGKMPVIDITPMSKAVWELHKIGTNFNQLMKNYNKYGVSGYDSKHANLVMEKIENAVSNLMKTLIALNGEATKHKLHIQLDAEDWEKDDDSH